MKSFGARLTAGLVTIVLGAYAAALAQKDKQNSGNWSAQAPALGEPAAPIADMNDDSWLSTPSTAGENSLAQAAGAFSNSSVALVQHTEEIPEQTFAPESPVETFAPASMPASLGEPAEADWSLPAGDQSASEMSVPAMTMSFPGDDAQQAAPVEENYGSSTEQPAETSPMPTLSLAQAPDFAYDAAQQQPQAMEAAPEPKQPQFDNAQFQNAEFQSNPVASNGSGNYLRDRSTNDNVLRGNEPAPEYYADPPAPEPGLMAQQDPRFAQPAPVQPEPVQPQPINQFAPSQFDVGQFDVGQGYDNAPDRIASRGTEAIRGMQPQPSYQPQQFEQPTGAIEIEASAVIDAPGDRRLDGAQSPSIVIQKRAPAQVKVGKPASFVIHVQNVGAAEALDVKVHDRVPAGMRLVDASPAPVMQGNVLMWELGAMPVGDERTVTMQLIPETEGELGSVARVTFEAAASVRTISTKPELKIVQRAPEQVLIGQQLEIELEVSNPGSGDATNVSLQEDVPEGLEHPKGRQLDNMIGTLAPGEVRRQVLRLRAVSPGMIQNDIRLVSDDGLTAEHSINVEVISPNLVVDLQGPSRRFLERQATYQLEVVNNGTADATNVEIAVQLDRGFTFVSTDYEGQYDPSRHAVYWSLARLPSGQPAAVPLTLLPVVEGERAIVIDARADLGVVARSERAVNVEGFAELSFQIKNPGGPIELGAETSYEITVHNSGSKPDSNVQVQLQLPHGLELISADGDAGTDGRGLVAFQPKTTLQPGGEFTYRVRVRGVAPGTYLVKAVVVSEQATVPVTKEESTLVYADQ